MQGYNKNPRTINDEVVKMQNQQLLTLKNPGVFESLDATAADQFEEAERKTLPLLEKIIQPFTETNKERTGYTNKKRPEEETRGEHRFATLCR